MAVLLLYTSPIFVMLISLVILKEKMNKNKIIALIFTLIGLGFITGFFNQSISISSRVILFGLGSGLGYALYSIFGKILLKKYHTLTITTYTFVFASIGVLPFIRFEQFKQLLFFENILLALSIAIICTVLPYLAYTKGLETVEASHAAIIVTIEPLVGVLLGIVIFNESMDIGKFIGMICIFTSILVLNMRSKRIGKKNKIGEMANHL